VILILNHFSYGEFDFDSKSFSVNDFDFDLKSFTK